MSKEDVGRVVIHRPHGKSERHHDDSWKIAYADFVTAMMSFFLVMWLVSIVPKKELQGVAEYFRMPLMTAIVGGPKVDTSTTLIPGGSPSVIPNKDPLPQKSDDDALKKGRNSAQQEEDRHDTQRLEGLKSDIDTLIKTDPILKEFKNQLLLDMTPDGLRVEIVDKPPRPMFATGKAQVQPYMGKILRRLGPVFNKLPNKVTISGHTDAIQYATGEREYSNWELSADRANSARKELVAGGMDERKVKRILGLSSSVSLVKDNPNAAVNRRISLVVLNKSAERRIDEQDAVGTSSAQLRDALSPSLPEPESEGAEEGGEADTSIPQ
jgi:chemotaxis protein MotB